MQLTRQCLPLRCSTNSVRPRPGSCEITLDQLAPLVVRRSIYDRPPAHHHRAASPGPLNLDPDIDAAGDIHIRAQVNKGSPLSIWPSRLLCSATPYPERRPCQFSRIELISHCG